MVSKKEELGKIAEEIRKTKPLFKGITNPVPGEGNPEAEIMFIGEAPGYWEDKKGRPFVGQAGRLLEQLLLSIKLRRGDVFIGNLVHWRPPGNRDPTDEEIAFCQKFIDAQTEVIKPKIIATLGRFSMAKFIPEGKISAIHGQARFVDVGGRKTIVLPLFHPAAGLRSADVAEKLKADFAKIPRLLEEKGTEV